MSFYNELCEKTQSTWVKLSNNLFMDAYTHDSYYEIVFEAIKDEPNAYITIAETNLNYPVIYVIKEEPGLYDGC